MTTEALRQLYREHHPRFRCYMRALLPCDADADVVANTAWLELINAMRRTAVRNPWALLITIGKRRARDWWRDHQAERDELQRYCDAERDDEFARLPDKAEQLSLAIKRSEFVDEPISNAALNAAVRTLPIRQRLAVFLRYLAGLDAAETAEYMGISTRRVNQLLERACQELRSSPLAPGYDPEAAARRTEARS